MANGHGDIGKVYEIVNELKVDLAKTDTGLNTKLDGIDAKLSKGDNRMDKLQAQIETLKADNSEIKQTQARQSVIIKLVSAVIGATLVAVVTSFLVN